MKNKPLLVRRAILLFSLLSICSLFFISESVSFAQTNSPTEYTLLAPLPLTGDAPNQSANSFSYIPGMVRLVIAVAGVLAVLRLIISGIQYMSSDAWSQKSDAKSGINEAFWGLGLAVSAWLILATVNPELVKFNLSIPSQLIPNNPTTPEGGGTGGGGGTVGCQGNCPHSYQRGDTTISYKDCLNCSNATSFGLIIKEKIVNGQQAQLNNDLGNKLKALKDSGKVPGFTVTETWPPTVNHANQKQYDGTSVDISLLIPSPDAIQTFLNEATRSGLKAVYEVKSAYDKESLVKLGIPPINILVVPRITGAHFSVQ